MNCARFAERRYAPRCGGEGRKMSLRLGGLGQTHFAGPHHHTFGPDAVRPSEPCHLTIWRSRDHLIS